MIKIAPARIYGNWKSGMALDLHTVSSTYLGVNAMGRDEYDNVRSEIGELLYNLKYKSDLDAGKKIIDRAVAYLSSQKVLKEIDLIIPVPPSAQRAMQPVPFLANGISDGLRIPNADCIVKIQSTEQLKGVVDVERRKELIKGVFTVDKKITKGKDILLIDDLYRSGTTLNEITDLLMGEGKANSVRVLAITRTRKNQ